MLCIYFNKGIQRSAVVEFPTAPYFCRDGKWIWVSSFSFVMVMLINIVQRFLKGFLGAKSDHKPCRLSLAVPLRAPLPVLALVPALVQICFLPAPRRTNSPLSEPRSPGSNSSSRQTGCACPRDDELNIEIS